MDEQIGRVLEALEQTLILFTADHGDMTGDHHLWRKSYAYEASARIPILLRWLEGLVAATRGEVLREPVELRDVLRTLVDAAGAPLPKISTADPCSTCCAGTEGSGGRGLIWNTTFATAWTIIGRL